MRLIFWPPHFIFDNIAKGREGGRERKERERGKERKEREREREAVSLFSPEF